MSTPRRRRGRFRLGRRSPFLPPAPPDERTTVVDEGAERPVPPPEEPGRDLWPWLLALLALVAAGLALAWWLTRDDDDEDARPTAVLVRVPSLVDLERGEAVRRAGRAGLRVRTRNVPSEEDRGTVVAQEPPAGERVRRGTTLALNISEGPPPVALPDLVGRTEAQAASRLTALGLRANVVRVESTAPDGQVVAQNPAPGERVAVGSRVRLNVSSGVTQTQTMTTATTTATTTTATTTVARTVSVPDVVGVQETQAATTLERAGLLADSYPVSSNEPGGIVVGQNPAGGGTAQQGSVIRLNVSVGTRRRPVGGVPDVTGLAERAARRLLRRAGYTVRAIYRTAREPEDVGEVVLQAPTPGRNLPVYAQVTIYVARA